MAEESPAYIIVIEKIEEILNNKLIAWGIPAAISIGGIASVRERQWGDAIQYFAAAAAAWGAIQLGKKLAPKLDKVLDWGIEAAERSLLNAYSALRSDITATYLRQQAGRCEEFTTEGFNPDRTAIPLLEEVFVPLDLSGALADLRHSQDLDRWQRDPKLMSDNLDIWKLLARSRKDRKFRQMVILAKGGMGKTTLMRHIALIYSQRKQRRYRAPRLVPMLLRLRDWTDELTQSQPPGLPQFISEHYVPSLSKNHPLSPPPTWAEKLLNDGKALVMFDGFDEVPAEKRPQVSQWLSAQMKEYKQSVFILTSRPAGYKDYTAQKPTIPIYINKFNTAQQHAFIRRWYLCQERSFRSQKQRRQAQAAAKDRSDNLIAQLEERREELGYMAENPLLLNMLVTYHRFDPAAQLPRQRLGLYQGICKLQLDDRPRARLIRMVLPYAKSIILLQIIAREMVQFKRLTLPHDALLRCLQQQSLLKAEEVDPAEWLKQIVEVSELLVEREPGEYEFPHASFQGFFAATLLAKPQNQQRIEQNARLVLQNWNEAIWRETVLLYTAQLPPRMLDWVIRNASNQGSEAADLAAIALKEYPRPEKLSDALTAMLQNLGAVTHNKKYARLEQLLKAQQWRDADQETYRLMITTVGKEKGQWFDTEDLINFPCEDLKAIDGLWTTHSGGQFGFSVQKEIWVKVGGKLDFGKDEAAGMAAAFGKMSDINGWRKFGEYISYEAVTFDTSAPRGHLPALYDWGVGGGCGVFLLSHPGL